MNFDNYTDEALNACYEELSDYREELPYDHDDRSDAVNLMILIGEELTARELERKRPYILTAYREQRVPRAFTTDDGCCSVDDCRCHTLTKDEVADYLFDDEPSPILGSPVLEKRLTELEEILKAITTRKMFLKDMTYDQIVSLHGADYAASWLARED